jgi:hypothetical protein
MSDPRSSSTPEIAAGPFPCPYCQSVGLCVYVYRMTDERVAERDSGEWHTCRRAYWNTAAAASAVVFRGVGHTGRKPLG